MGNEEKYYQSLGIKTRSAAFKRYKNAGMMENIDEAFVKEVRDYWYKHYGKEVDPTLPIAFSNLTGKKDVRVAYPVLVLSDFIPYFNNQIRGVVYRDKNLYDKLIPSSRSVETILKRINGLYFNSQDKILDRKKAILEILSYQEDMIIKPSDTNNGVGVKKLLYKGDTLHLGDKVLTLESLEEEYGGNFSVQKIIQQHPLMAAPHPASVNTLRMVTLRWNNEIKYLLTFARFGAANNVQDNAGAGGLCVGVTEAGKFLDKAVDENSKVHTHHPTTNYAFKDLTEIPNFDEFKKFVKELHEEIPHHDFISWDIVVGADGLPVFLEANFKGATWLYQLAAEQPLFGDLTEEILEHVSKDRNNPKSSRYRKLETAKRPVKPRTLRRRIRRLRNENNRLKQFEESSKNLKQENEELLNRLNKIQTRLEKRNTTLTKELEYYQRKYNDMKNSNSWRITGPMRKITSIIKRK